MNRFMYEYKTIEKNYNFSGLRVTSSIYLLNLQSKHNMPTSFFALM